MRICKECGGKQFFTRRDKKSKKAEVICAACKKPVAEEKAPVSTGSVKQEIKGGSTNV